VKDVIIVGGGLSGLVNSILLARSGLKVQLIEKNRYPFHKVCGEYISNEVKPYLDSLGLYPHAIGPVDINRFELSSVSGKIAKSDLALGGFGISRYSLDQFLVKQAIAASVQVTEATKVKEVRFDNDQFELTTSKETYHAKFVIGAYGKRTQLDSYMNRSFMLRRSPYMGVKYHIKIDRSHDTVSLHNFRNGYCGISQVENESFNLCYLSHRDNMKGFSDIATMERSVLFENPRLQEIWSEAEFMFDKPLVINEVSFAKKTAVENHILMSGDSAGLITPLCGNGMAMAIRSAHMLSSLLISAFENESINRQAIENHYTKIWDQQFEMHLSVGRAFQKLFGGKVTSEIAVRLMRNKPIAKHVISWTHGKPMV